MVAATCDTGTDLTESPKLFGAYVVSISTSLSWGSQGASTQFKLVEDLCPEKDEDKAIINIPPLGSPVIFPGFHMVKEEDANGNIIDVLKEATVGANFTPNKPLASGFLQRWTYKESQSGGFYDVVISSPAIMLDGVQVILNKFDGHGSGGLLSNEVLNVLNVYAHYENYLVGGHNWTIGAGGFGDSGVNDLGFPLGALNEDGEIVNLLGTLGSMTLTPDPSTAFSNFGGPLRYAENKYKLDLSALYAVVVQKGLLYYRISGDVRDLAGIITEVCDIIQHDWMIELVDNEGLLSDATEAEFGTAGDRTYGGNVPPADFDPVGPAQRYPTLRLKLMNRSQQPTQGAVKNYILNARDPNNGTQNNIISASYGEELTQGTTAKIVLGAPVSRYLDLPIDDSTPLWAKGDGHWQMQSSSTGTWDQTKKDVYTRDNLFNPNYHFTVHLPVIGQYEATLFEMRMLTATDPERSWALYKTMQTVAGVEPNRKQGQTVNQQIQSLKDQPWYADVQVDEELIRRMSRKQLPIQAAKQTRLSAHQQRQKQAKIDEFKEFFDALKKMAQDSFCRQFMFRLPLDLEEWYGTYLDDLQLTRENIKYVNTYGDLEAEQYNRSWELTSDAWALNPQVGRANFFNNGRLKPMVAWKRQIGTNAADREWGSQLVPPQGVPAGREVAIGDDMGDNWTYTGGGLAGSSHSNNAPWHAGGYSGRGFRLRNSRIPDAFKNLNINTQAEGLAPAYLFDSSHKIVTTDGGTLETEVYEIPGTIGTHPTRRNIWCACQASVGPIIIDELTTPYFGLAALAKYFFNVNIDLRLFNRPNSEHLLYEVPALRALPHAFGIPQQSNKYRYGPYFKVAAPNAEFDDNAYVAGKTQVEFDDSLSPENFGSYAGMDQAGFALTEIDVGRINPDETGYVELAGAPLHNIGDQLFNAGPYVTSLDVAVGLDGIKHTYKFNTWTPSFGKLAKYNIDILSRTGKSSFNNLLSNGGVSAPIFAGRVGGFPNYGWRWFANQKQRDPKRFGGRNNKEAFRFQANRSPSEAEADAEELEEDHTLVPGEDPLTP